ncbi:AUX/IAA domain [Dillenia turbinata]|uniref:Auxin-responsive protein n=1 Tax=Dillenia turbinata TaxID=194707 RepID=A0AAN8UGA7_9MAGN
MQFFRTSTSMLKDTLTPSFDLNRKYFLKQIEMFTESCKRLRIMKKSDAKGFGGFPLRSSLKDMITKEE